jgi:hypothetical protein
MSVSVKDTRDTVRLDGLVESRHIGIIPLVSEGGFLRDGLAISGKIHMVAENHGIPRGSHVPRQVIDEKIQAAEGVVPALARNAL